jgi:ketosteroid isomerase-like protein
MSQEEDAAVFRQAVRYWSDSNLEGVLSLMADDIVHTVNVDALGIPYVSSAEGKSAVAARLALIGATFVIDAFVVENFFFETDEIRANVLGYHTHRKTRERLDVKLRFKIGVRDGLIVRLEEFIDGPYFEAFEKFVKYLEQTAMEQGGTP